MSMSRASGSPRDLGIPKGMRIPGSSPIPLLFLTSSIPGDHGSIVEEVRNGLG